MPNNYEIDILLNSDNDIQYPYRGRIYSLGIKEPHNRKSISYQARVFVKRMLILRKLKHDNQYEASISIITSANIANVLTKVSGCRTVITEVYMPNERPSFKEKYIIGSLTSTYYNKADRIVAETKAIGAYLINTHRVDPDKIVIIPNSIDVDEINTLAQKQLNDKERDIFNKESTFVTAGRITYQKAHWHLIRAFSKVVQYDRSAKLVIFGEGELKEMLIGLVKAYRLENNVFLHGFTGELDKYVARCRAFVMPSMYEGMPTALLQAMAVGVPCIITDFYTDSHIQGVLYTEWGVMCQMFSGQYHSAEDELEESENVFAYAMIEMLSNKEIYSRYCVASRRRSIAFDNKNVIRKWMEII